MSAVSRGIRYVVSLFSCKRYTERFSHSLDEQLSPGERFAVWFHHLYCFICRRVARQLRVINNHAKTLNENDEVRYPLSSESRGRIKEVLDADQTPKL